MPLAPKETQKRRFAGMVMGCLTLVFIGTAAVFLLTDREREDHQEAHFKQMLAREQPGAANYHLMLGRSYAGLYAVNTRVNFQEGYARALVEYTKAIELDPNFAWAYKERAHAYSRLKDYARAIEDYNTYERLSDVVDWNFYGGRAHVYKNLGMYEKMCEDRLKEYCGNNTNESYKKLVEEGLCKY